MPSIPYEVFSDEVLVILEFLEGGTRLDVFNLDYAEDLTGWQFPERRLTIQPSGGTFDTNSRFALPRMDVNIYAETKPIAKTIALTAAAELRSMRNFVGTNLVVVRAIPSYPADISDPINAHPRYVFDLDMMIHNK